MQGKVVVVTGASRGIGAELARVLVGRGAQVVLVARSAEVLQSVAAETGGLAVVADVCRRDEVERVLAHTIGHFGRLDVWVNNAGRGISRPTLELTDDDFDEMMSVNVKSALYGMQVAVGHFRQTGRGQVVNVSSMLGRVPFAPIRSAYSAAKHALNALTAMARADLAQELPEVQVTLVLPGVVATEFGLRALGGGLDSRQMPGAQSAAEVAVLIADAIERPVAEVFTRPEQQRPAQARYYGAEG